MFGPIVLAAVAALPAHGPSYGVGGQVSFGTASLVGPDAAGGSGGDALAFGVTERVNEFETAEQRN